MDSTDSKLPVNIIDYRSKESNHRLSRCLTNGTAKVFLSLSSCYKTQSKTCYCGLTTLVVVLNSLQIDPSRVWGTKEQWYTENLLGSCRPLEMVENTGIPMEVFRCLALQNGVNCEMTRPKDDNKDFAQFQKALCHSCSNSHLDKDLMIDEAKDGESLSIVVVAYDRCSLGMQGLGPGIGHYSPIGAYDKQTQSVLVLDVARYRYPPHWIPVQLIFNAMLPVDPETGKGRGYFVLSRRKTNESVCLSDNCDCSDRR